MKNRKGKGLLFVAVGAVGAAASVGAQGSSSPQGTPLPAPKPPSSSRARLGVSAAVDGWFPKLLTPDSPVSYVLKGTAQLSYAPLPFVEALARAGVSQIKLDSNASLLYVGGSAGLGFVARLFERISVSASGFAGLGKILDYNGSPYGLLELGARLETSVRLSAALTLGISAGYERLATPSLDFIDAVSAGIRLKLSPAELARDRANVAIEKVETQSIFPVFRSWYDSEPLGAVTLRNNEDGAVENVRVSFFAPEYMGGPRLCAVVPRIERGESAVVPLYAVFDERVLTLTENGKTTASVDIEYSFLGSRRDASEGFSLSLHHRNAMSWEDDRRAAAFVSSTDPAALWFSRFAASVVRDRMRSELPPNLQYALGIFESLKLYGLNYVIDPNSSYVDMSANEATVDFLQYPSQTLMYRGGDCDDLSILFCSLLESSGIETAFITIPGHIYMAFDLGMDEADARDKFFDPGLLIFRDGRAWAPVEITMVKDGFVKAWRVGAKQWVDNFQAGSAAFFPIHEAWKRYRPSGLQDAASRFALPDEAKAMASFDAAVDRFVSRELEPIVAEYEKRLGSKRDPAILNDYGMTMAQVGMLDAAWEKFSEAAKAGYAWSWNNLASIAFVRKDYQLAHSYYEWTTTLLPGDPVAVLGMARAAYELDRYSEAETLYSGLKIEAPELAARYGYLASAYGGQGRAWSMADRLAGSVWSKPGLNFKPAVAAVAPSIPTEAPAVIAPAEASTQVAIGPEAAPTAKTIPVDEAAIVPAPETAPVAAVVPAPEPIAPPVPTALSATIQALAAAKAQDTNLKPKDSASILPPSVVEKPPEDIEIAAAASSAIAMPSPTSFTAAPPTEAPVAQAPKPAIVATVTETTPTATTPAMPIAPIAQALPVTPTALAPATISEEDAELAAIAAQKAAAQALAAKSAAFTAQAATSAPVTAVAETKAPVVTQAAIVAPTPAASSKGTLSVETVKPAVTVPAPVAVPAPVTVPAPEAKPTAAISVPAPTTVQAPIAVPAPVTVPAPEAKPTAAISVPAPVSVQAPITVPAPVTQPAPEATPKTLPELLPPPAFSPTARFTSTVDHGGAPAFGKRLPEGADASGYTKIKISDQAAAFIDLRSADVRVANGNWKQTDRSAKMTDAKAMYAKLVLNVPSIAAPTTYEFKARSTGTGWVGFGIHIHGRGEWKLSGYGGGDSILVWVTSDPKTFGDSAPRLQVYRSQGNVSMPMLSSVRLPGSAFDLRSYRIDYDPASGKLTVYVDGARSLELTGITNPGAYQYAAFRALDLAEFSDLAIRASSLSGTPAETPHE